MNQSDVDRHSRNICELAAKCRERQQLLKESYDREDAHLKSLAWEIGRLNDAEPGSDEFDVIAGCILDGDDYDEAKQLLARMEAGGAGKP